MYRFHGYVISYHGYLGFTYDGSKQKYCLIKCEDGLCLACAGQLTNSYFNFISRANFDKLVENYLNSMSPEYRAKNPLKCLNTGANVQYNAHWRNENSITQIIKKLCVLER